MKTKKRLLYVLIPIICLTVTAAIVLPIVLTQCNNKAKNLVIKNLSKRFNVIRGGYVEKTFTIEDNLGNKIENAEFYDLEFDNQYLDVTLPQKVSNNQYKFTVTGKMIGMSDISFKTKVDSQNLEPAISGSISVNVILNDNDIEIEGCEQMVIVETNEEKTYYFKIISYPSETNISDATFEDIWPTDESDPFCNEKAHISKPEWDDNKKEYKYTISGTNTGESQINQYVHAEFTANALGFTDTAYIQIWVNKPTSDGLVFEYSDDNVYSVNENDEVVNYFKIKKNASDEYATESMTTFSDISPTDESDTNDDQKVHISKPEWDATRNSYKYTIKTTNTGYTAIGSEGVNIKFKAVAFGFYIRESKQIKVNAVGYKVDGTNWKGNKMGELKNTDYTIDNDNKTVTYHHNSTTALNMDYYIAVDLVIPSKVKIEDEEYTVIIGNNAFYGCDLLSGSLTMPNNENTIGESAFSKCFKITHGTLIIPSKVTGIKDSAFSECDLLDGADLTRFKGEIGKNVFGMCGNLKYENVLLPPHSTSNGYWTCYDDNKVKFLYSSNKVVGCVAFGELTNNAFNAIKSVEVGKVVIVDNAFDGCMGLKGNLVIADNVNKIGKEAFKGCTGFQSTDAANNPATIFIPESLNAIDENAFNGCDGICKIISNWVSEPTAINSKAFEGLSTNGSVKSIPLGYSSASLRDFLITKGLSNAWDAID